MFVGMLISTVGGSKFWPYLMIYVNETLDAPLTVVASLMTLNSVFGLSWRIAIGVGPILGGVLNDNLGPKAIWYGGVLIGLMSVTPFLVVNGR